ncbi:MAG TPA: hypothetical protein VEK15_32730 [Vicinamibacteria bacterium]|nr:hypothetical protein [Vicinamibacteria bacterium]
MLAFLTTVLSFPTVVFTVLLGLTLLYWLVVIAGAVDLDFLDGVVGLDGAEAALDGALEHVDGALDSLDRAADVAAEPLETASGTVDEVDVDGDGGSTRTMGWLMNAMGVRGVPVTIVASFVIFWAWILSYAATRALGPLGASIVVGLFVGAAALGASFVLAAFTSRPFKKLFVTHLGARRASLVGKMCTVTSTKVDEQFGRAEIDDGGSGFVAEVRCSSQHDLRRGSRALVFRYEPVEGVFFIGPIDEVLAQVSGEGKK